MKFYYWDSPGYVQRYVTLPKYIKSYNALEYGHNSPSLLFTIFVDLEEADDNT